MFYYNALVVNYEKGVPMRSISITMIFLLGLFLLSNIAEANPAQKKESLSFTEVVDNLDLTKKTSLYVKEYWTKIKGEEVFWSGVVQNVKGGRGKAEVFIANKSRKTYKGYNIILISYEMETASALEIGQNVTFSGYLHNYKGRKGNAIVIILNEATITAAK